MKYPLLQTPNDIAFQNSDVEGEQAIKKIEGYRFLYRRIILSVFLNSITSFLFGLVCLWFTKFKIWFFYKKTHFPYSTYFLITNVDDSQSLVKKETFQNIIYFQNRNIKYVFDETT